MRYVKFLTLISLSFVSLTAEAQNVAFADMQQDLALLRREVGQLRLEVEQLTRQNEQMAQKLRKLEGSASASDVVSAQVSAVRSQNAAQMEQMKREIVAQVKKDMESMANQTNAAMGKLANAIQVRPQAEVQKTFSDDYPKTGITHTVRSGDSLSKLSREFNSRIKWIQDANKIVDPSRGLRVGDPIFIPQK